MSLRNYTRWRRTVGTGPQLVADILGAAYTLIADPFTGKARLVLDLDTPLDLSPDEARMLGVRLIEAATLADGTRSIRTAAES